MLLVFFSLYTSAYGDTECFLNEPSVSCDVGESDRTITVNFDSFSPVVNVSPPSVNVSPKLELMAVNEINLRDGIGLFLAFLGLAGFSLNGYIFVTQKKYRRIDKEREKFDFWLKEIIYPNHIASILTLLIEVEKKYHNWINENDEEKATGFRETFLETWRKSKIELLHLSPSDPMLPYLDDMFSELRKEISNLDDYFLEYGVEKSELFSLSSEVAEVADVDAAAEMMDKDIVASLIRFVYSCIHREQGD